MRRRHVDAPFYQSERVGGRCVILRIPARSPRPARCPRRRPPQYAPHRHLVHAVASIGPGPLLPGCPAVVLRPPLCRFLHQRPHVSLLRPRLRARHRRCPSLCPLRFIAPILCRFMHPRTCWPALVCARRAAFTLVYSHVSSPAAAPFGEEPCFYYIIFAQFVPQVLRRPFEG